MADTNTSASVSPAIEALPDEMLLKILSYIPVLHLNSSVAKVCQRWSRLARDKTLGTVLELSLNYEEHYSNPNFINKFSDIMEMNKNIRHIKIINEEKLQEIENVGNDQLSEKEWQKGYCFFQMYRLLRALPTKLKTIYLEDCFEGFLWLIDIPSINDISLNCSTKLHPHHSVNAYTKVEKDARTVNVQFANFNSHSPQLFHLLYELSHRKLAIDISLKFLRGADSITILDDGLLNFSSLKSYENLCNSIEAHKFQVICRHTNMQQLSLKLAGIISLVEFSHVQQLTNLNCLTLYMDYSFTRQELIKVFKGSRYTKLRVNIHEFKSKGEDETITLNNGHVTIFFTKHSHSNP